MPRPNEDDPDAALLGRRLLVFGLLGLGWAGLAWAMAARVGGAPGIAVLVLFLLGAPWTVLVTINGAIGLLLLRRPDAALRVNPLLGTLPATHPGRAAVCMAIRNEDPARVTARLSAMAADLDGHPDIDLHLISDSDARHEPAEAAAARTVPGLHYRRRASNAGYKAGNLQDFAATHRDRYEVMIVLDADSLMSAAALRRLVRVMHANPRLGILQTLVVGRPAESAFTRAFQFGMRHGMRSHTLGAAWWQGPSGPFWGHNAAVRLRPFVDHCALPTLPGRPPFGGPVLSHDQVEAALMRAAGWQVRVLADEDGSWEENPPNLPDFIRRNLRWCQGNLQYVHLVGRPGLRPMGRYQLANALLMYVGPVAWTAMLATAVASGQAGLIRAAFGGYLAMMLLGFLPRLFGVVEAMARPHVRRSYGGGARLLAGCAADALATLLTAPVTMLSEAIFVVGLLLGHRITWSAQARDDRAVPWQEAASMLWPQTLAGAACLAMIPGPALGWAAPVLAAWLLAIPYARWSAAPGAGRWMQRVGLCTVPDEIAPPPVLSGARPIAP